MTDTTNEAVSLGKSLVDGYQRATLRVLELEKALSEERELRIATQRRLASAEAEMIRIGYSSEPIFVFDKDTGKPILTSHVGDLCWDTQENRRLTFNYIAETANGVCK